MTYNKPIRIERRVDHTMKMKWMHLQAAAVLLLLAVGCSGVNGGAAPPSGHQGNSSEALPGHSAAPVVTPTPSAEPPATAESPAAEIKPALDEENGHDVSVASPEKETIEPEPSLDISPPAADSSAGTAAVPGSWEEEAAMFSFNPDQPTLMGVMIGSSLDRLRLLFGEPAAKHLLPDEDEEAAVFRYAGFSIGVADKAVLFVEVSSSEVNPGLNGLKIGDTKEKAVSALGKPTSETPYVLSYIGTGATLKLDLDPNDNRIHSIKLFPAR